MVLQKSEKPLFSQSKGEAGTWFPTADLFLVYSTRHAGFSVERDQPHFVYSPSFCQLPLITGSIISLNQKQDPYEFSVGKTGFLRNGVQKSKAIDVIMEIQER